MKDRREDSYKGFRFYVYGNVGWGYSDYTYGFVARDFFTESEYEFLYGEGDYKMSQLDRLEILKKAVDRYLASKTSRESD